MHVTCTVTNCRFVFTDILTETCSKLYHSILQCKCISFVLNLAIITLVLPTFNIKNFLEISLYYLEGKKNGTQLIVFILYDKYMINCFLLLINVISFIHETS